MTKRDKGIKNFFEKGYTIDSKGIVYNKKFEKLKLTEESGYYYITIRIPDSKIPVKIRIHRLQAYKKFGDKIFEKGIVVRHLNGNSKNNCYDNIEIGTQSENMYDKSINERNPIKFENRDNKDEILNLIIKGNSITSISKEFDVPRSTLNDIKKKI